VFKELDKTKHNSLTLSGNSYSTEACQYIAQQIKDWTNLRHVNFGNIFVSRLREDLPKSLKILMDSIVDKKIISLDLSNNAFGPDGVAKIVDFLEDASYLQKLNVSNCGLSPKGGEMIA
jgi:Ran GTPase-activating protein 1